MSRGIPIHASSNMLKAMRRGINREKTDALIKKIRERVPGIAMRTTLIVPSIFVFITLSGIKNRTVRQSAPFLVFPVCDVKI